MAPIVAWIVETEFYLETKSTDVPTGRQAFFAEAFPVSTGGVEQEDIVLGPDGTVYQLYNGHHWPDIDSYVKHEWDKVDAEEAQATQQ